MIKSRLMDTPQDYKKLGLKEGVVQIWEDGRRDFSTVGACEWWYFDATMDDGTTVAMSFHVRSPLALDHVGDCPIVQMNIDLPDGRSVSKYVDCTAEQSHFSTEKCDVKIGPHTISGDLKTYKIHIDPIDGYGLDLELCSESSPFRPDTGYWVFNDAEDEYFTWLCVIPRGKMEGTILFNGEERKVSGRGYHDHQWIKHPRSNTIWNHWFWGRQHFEDYTLVLGDMTSAERYGFVRYPLFVLQDKDGNTVFSNTHDDNLTFEIIKEADNPPFGKDYPLVTRYHFEKDGKTVVFTLSVKEVQVCEDRHLRYPPAVQRELEEMGFHWTYLHFIGVGELSFTENGETINRKGELIYEMSYFGKNYKVKEKEKALLD